VRFGFVHFEIALDGVVLERFDLFASLEGMATCEGLTAIDPHGASPADTAATSGIEGEGGIELGLDLVERTQEGCHPQRGDVKCFGESLAVLVALDGEVHSDLPCGRVRSEK